MKLISKDNKIIVFLYKRINFKQINLENYFKKLFIKFKEDYHIELNGYYSINIYIDKFYGSVIEIENEDLDYYNYFNRIDMEVKLNDNVFLYEIDYEYLNKSIINNSNIYKLKDKLYIQVKDNNILNKILEYSNIIYGEKIKYVLRNSKKVKL